MPIHASNLMAVTRGRLRLVVSQLRRLATIIRTLLISTKTRRVLHIALVVCAAVGSGIATYAINYRTNPWAAAMLALANAGLTAITLIGRGKNRP